MNNQTRTFHKTALTPLLTVEELVTVYRLNPRNSRGEAHDFWELFYLESGEYTVPLGGEEYRLHSGDLIFYPPGVWHGLPPGEIPPAAESSDCTADILSFTCSSPLLDTLSGRIHTLTPQEGDVLLALVRDGVRSLEIQSGRGFCPRPHTSPAVLQVLKNRLELFLLSLWQRENADTGVMETDTQGGRRAADEGERVLAYLSENIDRNPSLEEISRALGFSSSYLRALFVKRFGCGIKTYFNEMKIREAMRLLRRGSAGCCEVADRLGYSSSQYFSYAFHRATGRTPSEYADGREPEPDSPIAKSQNSKI